MEQKQYIIFDMDGTLVDSMYYWRMLCVNYLKQQGIIVEDVEGLNEIIKKLSISECGYYLANTYELKEDGEVIADKLLEMMNNHYLNDVSLKPKVLNYLQTCHQQGIKMCVASLTERRLMLGCLNRLDVMKYFDFVLSCEEVGDNKQKPTIYLEACRRFNCNVEDAMVFEDACYAAKTAKQAGFYVIGVKEPYTLDNELIVDVVDEIIDFNEVSYE